MNIADLIKISWRALLRNKTRALLTMLGIIIGIGSVIGMVSIGQSSSQSINDQISEMGTNLIMVMRKAERSGGVNIGSDSVQTMRASDADAILAGSKNVIMASPMVASAGQIVYGSQNWPGSIQGGNSSYLAINKRNISSGANFTENDVKQAAKVCLIGTTVRDNIFPNGENPLGKIIRFGKIPMKIIGVLESKGQNQMGQDQDDIVIAPYTTVQKRMLAVNYVHMIFASAASEDVAYAAVSDIENILRKEHRIKAGKDNDFEVRTQQQILEIMGSITGILTLLLTAVAAISLLVGGIGIMNIMYVTVTERTREIGLRMAVGGKNSDILMQFLAESTILSMAGGIMGIFLGVGLAFGASYALNWPFIVSLGSVAISFLVCALIGIFFGWYPARKAANLDPINALRYE